MKQIPDHIVDVPTKMLGIVPFGFQIGIGVPGGFFNADLRRGETRKEFPGTAEHQHLIQIPIPDGRILRDDGRAVPLKVIGAVNRGHQRQFKSFFHQAHRPCIFRPGGPPH